MNVFIEVIEAIVAALNSPSGLMILAGAILSLLGRLYAAKPLWQAYEGAIISAIKFAEKQIPDDADDTATKRLGAALRYVVDVFEAVNRRRAKRAEIDKLTEGIRITHAELETTGTLVKRAERAV